MLDENLLDDPAALRERDQHGALLTLAVSGARVRTAVRLAEEAGLDQLDPDGRPRQILIAGQGAAALAGDLVEALAGDSCPCTVLRPTAMADVEPGEQAPVPGARWVLPGWAGPMDLLVLVSAARSEPGLVSLAHQGYRRGCALTLVAPQDSQLAAAAPRVHAPLLPYAPAGPAEPVADPEEAEPGWAPPSKEAAEQAWPSVPAAPVPTRTEPLGVLWGLLPGLLLLGDRIGFLQAPPAALEAVADHLDRTAEECGPETPTHLNQAKSLAVELAETLPLIWTDGPNSRAVARRFSETLASRAGTPTVVSALPEALSLHRGLLRGALTPGESSEEALFRDRVEEPEPLRARVVLLADPVRSIREENAGREVRLGAQLAEEYQLTVTEPASPEAEPLSALAELLVRLDFGAVFLGIAST